MMSTFAGTLTLDRWDFGAATREGNGFKLVPALLHIAPDPAFPASAETLIMKTSFAPPFFPTDPTSRPQTSPDDIGDSTRNGRILQTPTGKDNALFFIDSRNWADKSRKDEVARQFGALLRIENPDVHNVLTVDCASCHVTTQLKAAVTGYGYTDLGQLAKADAFQSPKGVTSSERTVQGDGAEGAKQGYVTVNFGYFGLAPSISQRTVNESARVAADLNAMP
jgi:hypothetical protein